MNTNRILQGLSAAVVLAVVGCGDLDVTNQNEPDNKAALSDPAAVEAVAGGAMRTWFNAYTGLRSAGAMSNMARTYSHSWNNGNVNFYSGVDIAATDTATPPNTWTRNTRSWQNDPSAAARTSIDAFWGGGLDESATPRPGFYAALSAANDALKAIRLNNVVITSAAQTKRAETIAQLMQGAAMMMIALNYDKGYVVNENSDVATLAYSDRKALRDSAVAMLGRAATLAGANTFTTPASWANGLTYTNLQIQKIANTMAAMTLAWYPRDDAENATQVNWGQVVTLAAAGQGSGTPVDFSFNGDGYGAWISEVVSWCNSLDTCRISTRVAHLLHPASQMDPWPLGVGNPRPTTVIDRRLGDGSFGDASMVGGFGNFPKTAQGGTDFAWSGQAPFRPDRGFYHQSNIGHIRYDASGVQDPNDVYGGFGYFPAINATVSDLVHAEAVLRASGVAGAATAAALINKTRVTRGGLLPALAADPLGSDADGPCMSTGILAKTGGVCTLWSKLLYEYEIELLGLGPAPYYHHRHMPVITGGGAFDSPNGTKVRYLQGLLPGTPREMPVPYKELGVKGEALYTFGGASPAKSTPP